MPILPPTILEPLVRCGKEVQVDGLIKGAEVTITITSGVGVGEIQSVTAPGSWWSFGGLNLPAGATVTATQKWKGEAAPSSPAVVEGAQVPVESPPVLPLTVEACAGCVSVSAAVPGSRVEVFVENGLVIGSATAGPDGGACVSLSWLTGRAKPTKLSARMVVCNQKGTQDATALIVPAETLGAPSIAGPVLACTKSVPLAGLRPGAGFEIEVSPKYTYGFGCTCMKSGWANFPDLIPLNGAVRARLYREATMYCPAETGPWSAWHDVSMPTALDFQPKLVAVLWAGDQKLHVENQHQGAWISVLIGDEPDESAATTFGPRPAGGTVVDLGVPLKAGQWVAIRQFTDPACNLDVEALSYPWQQVQPSPATVPPPTVLAPLFECGGAVAVCGLYPGAEVRLYQDGAFCGMAWAGPTTAVSVICAPLLHKGGKVTATQKVGPLLSKASSPTVVGSVPTTLPVPRFLRQPTVGDTQVVVSSVLPGSRVIVRQAGTVIGDSFLADPFGRLPVEPIGEFSTLIGSTRFCDVVALGDETIPLDDVGIPGPFTVTETIYDKEMPAMGKDTLIAFGVDPSVAGEWLDAGIKLNVNAVLDLPKTERPPLVVSIHGLYPTPDNSGDTSFLGYRYLARRLASWGIAVSSIDVSFLHHVGFDYTEAALLNDYRARIAAVAVHLAWLKSTGIADKLDLDHICLVGHSMGGKAAAMAGAMSEALGLGPTAIRGVIAIAPTDYAGGAVSLPGTSQVEYLHLVGSADSMLTETAVPAIAGGAKSKDAWLVAGGYDLVRLYDHMPRPKTLAWIPGANHWSFNTVWEEMDPDSPGQALGGKLAAADQRELACILVTAFCRKALQGKEHYVGYLDGVGLPAKLRQHGVVVQREESETIIVDRFQQEPGGNLENDLGKLAMALFLGSGAVTVFDEVLHGGVLPWYTGPLDALQLDSLTSQRTLKLGWKGGPAFYVSVTDGTAGGLVKPPASELSLRLALAKEAETLSPALFSLDLLVGLLTSKSGAVVRTGALVTAPRRADNLDVAVFATCRIPADAFYAILQANPGEILGLVLLLNASSPAGGVYVDDVEWV